MCIDFEEWLELMKRQTSFSAGASRLMSERDRFGKLILPIAQMECSLEDKIEHIMKIRHPLCPRDKKYIKNIRISDDGLYGIIDYFWPEWLGFKIDNTDKPLDSIHPLGKDNPLPYDLTRVGPIDGTNFSDKINYKFDKLCIPYISELGVYRKIFFPVFDKYCHIIDKITENKCDTGNICTRDAFNRIYNYFTSELDSDKEDDDSLEFQNELFLEISETLVSEYRKYQDSLENAFGKIAPDIESGTSKSYKEIFKYGISGIAAGNTDVKLGDGTMGDMPGGAVQYVIPFTLDTLCKLNLLTIL